MKDLRVWFPYFWPNFNKNDNVFTWILGHKYNVIIDNINPELIITDGSPRGYENSIKVYYSGEPYYPDINTFHDDNHRGGFDYGLSSFYIDEPKHFRFPSYLYFLYDFIRRGDIDSLDYYFRKRDYNKDILQTKTKFCCFIQGGPVNGNDQYRDKFYKKLVDYNYKHIDCPGTRYNNMKRLPGESSNSTVQSKLKREFIKPYKFVLTFESTSVVNGYDGLMDLKIFDAFTSDTLPIYWGNRLVHKDLNTKSFINYHDYNSDEEVIEKMIEIDKNDDMYVDYMVEPPTYDNELLNMDYLLSMFDEILKNN